MAGGALPMSMSFGFSRHRRGRRFGRALSPAVLLVRPMLAFTSTGSAPVRAIALPDPALAAIAATTGNPISIQQMGATP